jgi:hypothetical protein
LYGSERAFIEFVSAFREVGEDRRMDEAAVCGSGDDADVSALVDSVLCACVRGPDADLCAVERRWHGDDQRADVVADVE